MARLKHYQRDLIREWFCPSPGYVLDFSNKTFEEFFQDHFDLNIYSEAFSEKGTSKFNRLLSFIEVSPPHVVIELLQILWSRRNQDRNSELEAAMRLSKSSEFHVSSERVETIARAIDAEDLPFKKLISDLAAHPSHTALPHLERISAEWTLDTVEREFQRAFDNLERDPEAAITAACSMLESLCRSILISRGLEAPRSLDIKSLYKEVREPLGLSPSKNIPDSEIENDVRAILSAISNAVQGIGALRTHAGTAHGRERGFRRIDPRIARLAVHSASTMSLFLVETWEKRFPNDKLATHQDT